MKQHTVKTQEVARRVPRQARSLYKIELMFEATMALLEASGLEDLTTNAIASKAGVSIGSLYQYFEDRNALLDALAARELAGVSDKVLAAMKTPPKVPGDRIRHVVRASLAAYGGRSRAHRILLEHSLTHHAGRRISPLLTQLQDAFVSQGIGLPDNAAIALTRAQAFVLTHALAGVVRAVSASDHPPPPKQVEDALVAMTLSFIASLR